MHGALIARGVPALPVQIVPDAGLCLQMFVLFRFTVRGRWVPHTIPETNALCSVQKTKTCLFETRSKGMFREARSRGKFVSEDIKDEKRCSKRVSTTRSKVRVGTQKEVSLTRSNCRGSGRRGRSSRLSSWRRPCDSPGNRSRRSEP